MESDRQNILGVSVNAIDLEDAVQVIAGWVETECREQVCVVPAHTVMDALDDSSLRRIINQSGLVTPDGMSIVWALKLLGRKGVDRVYGPDLMLACCQYGMGRDWKHYLFGSTPDVLEELKKRLHANMPGLQIAGMHAPPFREEVKLESREVIEQINQAAPDLVWVGLGSPKQEFWIHKHRGELSASVMIGVGAALDFLSGSKLQAPRWVQRSGLEWLYRFVQEPRRLWGRYSQYPRFAVLLAGQLLGVYHPGE
jgi:N-acetylglucosaminyldiphosphoundecaprenol N-acetyl-beta-D-mannosaminyltransferase